MASTTTNGEATNGTEAPTFEIPKMCKAGVVVNEGPDFHVEVQMVPVPEPDLSFSPYPFPLNPLPSSTPADNPPSIQAADEVLIRLNCTGICYSDLHFMMGDLGTPPMGHFGVRS